MRGKKTLINTILSLSEELVAIVCGFILPRLILIFFGSKYNGLTTSITQFLACAVLLRAGIGGATRAALYKPIADNNIDELNGIVRATDIFMKKIGIILGCAIIMFAAIYPFFVRDEFEWMFTFSLFIIIGASTFAESFFGITYLIVLQADQRLWVSSVIKIICYIGNTILSVLLMYSGCSLHLVKFGSAVIYVLYPICLNMYVVKHYKIDKMIEPNNKAIAQRWDAFWQQVAVFVMNNTDVIVLTIFTNMLEVSVYSVYNLVATGLKRLVTAFSNGLEAAFGNMIARNELQSLKENVSLVEIIMYSISTIAYTVAALLIFDFVTLYTKGITDVNYQRPAFAYLLLIAQFFNGIRLPYQLVVQAAGHYKQTKKGAIIEPIINLMLSIILVLKMGLVGVAIGTLAATIFRTLQYSIYMSKNIVHRNQQITFYKVFVSGLQSAIVIMIANMLPYFEVTNFFDWVIKAIATTAICISVVILGDLIAYNREMRLLIYKCKIAIHRK